MKRLGAAPVLIAILLLGSPGAAGDGEGPEQEPLFEVLVLGTYHAPGMFLSPAYTPAHIRATLMLAKPDVIGVESHPTWFEHGRFHVVTYEAQRVAVPFARESGIPAYGIDWKDIAAWDRSEERTALQQALRVRSLLETDGPIPPFAFGRYPGAISDSYAARLRESPIRNVDWEHINDVHSDEFGKSRYKGKSPDAEDFAQERDRGIAANIVRVMEKHPGRRIAVVVGAHHKPYLDILLGKRGDVRVLKLGRDVPAPTPEQVESAWTPSDLLACLGHNLDSGASYFHGELVDLDRMKGLLARLEKGGEHPGAARYFRARIHVLSGEHEEAEAKLDDLVAAGEEGDVYPFPMRVWRMRYSLSEAARLEKARLLLLRGEEEAARPLLDCLSKALAFRLRQLELTRPRELRRVEAVNDPGFEAGGLGSDYYSGWYTFVSMGHGKLSFAGDEETKTEGERSLRVEIVEPVRHAYGFHVRQEVRIPPAGDLPKKLRIGLALRGEGIDWAKLEAVNTFGTGPSKPIASSEVRLVSGSWTRAEIEIEVPENLAFGFVVRFSGKKGARLWLDDALPLSVEYVTIPREWSRLALARAFPGWLLEGGESRVAVARAPTAPAPPAASGLRDPGFESGGLAKAPILGWYCHAASTGLVRVSADPEVLAEGQRSLKVEVVTPGGKFPAAVSQVVSLSGGGAERTFSIALRAKVETSLKLGAVAFVTPTNARSVGLAHITLKPGEWSRHEVRFRLAESESQAGLFVYLPETSGVTIWLDDARVE